jgi:hypothetical protein
MNAPLVTGTSGFTITFWTNGPGALYDDWVAITYSQSIAMLVPGAAEIFILPEAIPSPIGM